MDPTIRTLLIVVLVVILCGATPETPGGQWIPHRPGRWDYQASPTNLQYYSEPEMMQYFKNIEPYSKLYMPHG
jgi:hypothetical protein